MEMKNFDKEELLQLSQEVHPHEHNAPTYNIHIGYVDKQINGNYYECALCREERHKDSGAGEQKAVGGRKKVLFMKDGQQYAENLEVKRREAQRMKDFLKAHKLMGRRLNTQQTDSLNEYVVEFLRRWRDGRLIGDRIPGAAVFRFLTEDVGLEGDVEETAYASKIVKMVASLHVSVKVGRLVGEAFREQPPCGAGEK
ncbi:MAG: hypothetical protein ACI3X9_01210 [Bacteroidaceae bacterium]